MKMGFVDCVLVQSFFLNGALGTRFNDMYFIPHTSYVKGSVVVEQWAKKTITNDILRNNLFSLD